MKSKATATSVLAKVLTREPTVNVCIYLVLLQAYVIQEKHMLTINVISLLYIR